jgi:hypothetical protein
LIPPTFTHDEEVLNTKNAIEAAEEITGYKMPGPNDPNQFESLNRGPVYKLHGAADEDKDTLETRKSIATAENMMKKKFFINAKDARDYEARLRAGLEPGFDYLSLGEDSKFYGKSIKEALDEIKY